MGVRYTQEQRDWVRERYPDASRTVAELAFEFEEAFGLPMSRSRLSDLAHRVGAKRDSGYIRYTPEMDGFLRGFIPGHSESEIRDAFRERFGIELNKSRIQNARTRLGVRSGTVGGRFEPGCVPANKGRTWEEQGISPEAQERMRSTCFKKGSEPLNGQNVAIGSERVTRDGYIEVKVKRFSDRPCANKCWRMKHHLVWEEANGCPVPPSTMIVFADGDKGNLDPGNLVAVPRRIWATISHTSIPYSDAETLRTAMAIAEVVSAAHGASMRPRECKSCGAGFSPRFARQRTCDACLGRRSGKTRKETA